eukprot:TRINITY_DN12287_c0_g1_i1.p2 TRINITY_DN12287_c0_g1~~TRINITY_DN12287_c0_g1_i1.p2  ORF type:complete len:142 (+),score=11.92 TRINITY_DN12287_c0_g1_i1:2-427(+)
MLPRALCLCAGLWATAVYGSDSQPGTSSPSWVHTEAPPQPTPSPSWIKTEVPPPVIHTAQPGTSNPSWVHTDAPPAIAHTEAPSAIHTAQPQSTPNPSWMKTDAPPAIVHTTQLALRGFTPKHRLNPHQAPHGSRQRCPLQ